MSGFEASTEISFPHHGPSNKGKIIKTTVILTVLTIIELILGYSLYKANGTWSSGLVLAIKGVIVILTFAKAFYIVSVFMHLGDEIRNFIMTILVPLSLFIWFIIAFLYEGNSWLNMRHRSDKQKQKVEQTQPKNNTPAVRPGEAR
jgi:cytochrome c oxidase subunit IV